MNNNVSIQVIADGSVLEALKQRLGADEFSNDFTQARTVLIVYAASLSAGATQRSESGGLKLLQKVLAHPSSVPVPVNVVGFRSPDQYFRYKYLWFPSSPITYTQLPNLQVTQQEIIPSDGEWERLARIASEMELEIACAGYRHGLRSVMAAARIYLGAAIANHVTSQNVEATLPRLEQLVQEEDPSVSLSSRGLIKQLSAHQRFRNEYKSIVKIPKARVWFLDDHWSDHGWEIVLDDLMPGRVTGFTSWAQLEQRIRQGARRPDVLVIDCNLGLGDHIPTGLELLYSIRSLWQDVRIIFATAYDDAALALTSLREGANLFFAKALDDPSDRSSLDYYVHFAELLKRNELQRKISTRWQEFQLKAKERTPVKVTSGLPQPSAVFGELCRLAFYVLFSVVERNLWWVGKDGVLSEGAVFNAVTSAMIVGFPELETLAGKKKVGKDNKSLAGLIRACKHGGQPISFDDLLEFLDFVLAKLENQVEWADLPMKPWARPKPSYWPYETRAMQTDSTHPGLPVGTPVTSHEVAENVGAIELVRGIYCLAKCKHSLTTVDDVLRVHATKKGKKAKSYEDVAFADDHGGQSGWFAAIDSFLPGCRTYEDVGDLIGESRQKGVKTSLVLLDLKIPTYDDGLKALNRLLLNLPSVPIVALSAGYDSLAAIRSLKSGATDFVSKTLAFPRSPVACFEFADELRTKSHLLLKFGRSRCRAQGILLDRLRYQLTWSNSGDLEVLERRIDSWQRSRKKRSVEVDMPTSPATWGKNLSDEIALVLFLRNRIFWLNEKMQGAVDPTRLNVERIYQIRPLDYWRWEQVLSSNDTSSFVKLGAILFGGVIDRIARWNWCLENNRPLALFLWGTTARGSIRINDAITKIGGNKVWNRRNQALYLNIQQPKAWDQNLFDSIIEDGFAALNQFLSRWGANF